MEHVKNFEKRIGCDLGYHKNIHPKDGEGCVGKSGINKKYTLQQVIDLAYRMEEKPNIIIKAGTNAKWYLKKFTPDIIEEEIIKLKRWKDVSRCTMYIIVWD